MWKKMVGPALLVGLLWIGGGGLTTYYIMRLQASLAKVLRESMSAVRLSGEMEATLWRMQAAVMEAGQYRRPSFPGGGSAAELELQRTLESLRRAAISEQELQQIEQISDRFSKYRHAAHQVVIRGESNGSEPTPPTVDDTTHLAASLASECKEYSALEQRILMEAIDHYGQLTRGVNALRLILFCTGPVIGVLLGVWITRHIKSSIHRVSVRLQDPAIGHERDLGHVDISATCQLPELQKQVQEVSSRLNQAAGYLECQPAERSVPVLPAGDLAAGIVHELRNPLTSLKLLIQAAARKQRDRPLSDKQFQILQDEITRMEGTIQSLLDFTRPPQLRRRVHNVCDTLRRSLNLVRTRANQNGVTLLEGLPNERIMVHGDAEQLYQVFVNLLLNAMEAMPDGGTMRVAIGGITEHDPICRIKCSDTGNGIPADMLERIFEPFVSGKEHGHGLGLAVSRRIVAEHGGSISAANRPEGGALFTVALPFVSIEHESKPPGSDPDLAARPASDPNLAVQPAR